jgi:hypothetical protein
MALYAFDGTWNLRDSKLGIQAVQSPQWGRDRSFRRETLETNVHRFSEFYGLDRTEYIQGVGTRFGFVGRLVGGAFGVGAKFRLRHMYYALCRRYYDGDHEIDVVGFSRGAALAVHFTNVVSAYGIRNLKGARDRGFWYYRGLGWTFRFPQSGLVAAQGANGSEYADNPAQERQLIRFLGLWDTVGSFGMPFRPFRNRSSKWLIARIPPIVKRSWHAMALDEVRPTFSLVRPEPSSQTRHYEVWFRGVHSNIGGGYLDRGLSDITLAWMMEMYLWTLDKCDSTPALPAAFIDALRGISPARTAPPTTWIAKSFETLEPDVDGELGRPAEKRRLAWRDIPKDALIHHSVFRRQRNLITDHYRSNRRLLRQLPRDARPVYDPPFFYNETPRQAAERVAAEAFMNIPVRACEWFQVGGECVVRSDDWLAAGQRRDELRDSISLNSFVAVAAIWLLAGKPDVVSDLVKEPLTDAYGRDVPAERALGWLIEVLRGLEPYVPDLRAFGQGTSPRTRTAELQEAQGEAGSTIAGGSTTG